MGPQVVPPQEQRGLTTPAQRRLTQEQADQIRGIKKKLPPKTQEALERWAKMSETDRKGMLAMNLLVLVLILGILCMLVIVLIGFFQVNPFELVTYKNWRGTLQKIGQQLKGLHVPAKKSA